MNLLRFVSSAILTAMLLAVVPTVANAAPTQAEPEIRAVWVASLAPGIRAPEEVPATIDALRRGNLNTLIAQVRRQGMTYFQSEIEPRATTIEGPADWDPLANIVRQSHDISNGGQRLDVYAWLNVYAVGNQEHLAGADPTPIAEAHPEWYSLTRDGEPTSFIDPGVPAYQNHFVALVTEVLTQYDVDGINLDFVRYPEEGAGYNPVAIERFQAITGRDDVPEPDDPEWMEFCADQVTAMVRRLQFTVAQHRPEAMLSVCAVGFGAPPREGQTFHDTSPYTQVHQDWVGWADSGDVDVVTRMGYKREHVPEQAADFRGWADLSRDLQDRSGRPITCGIGGYFNQPEGTFNQYREAVARGLGTTLFSYHRPLGNTDETGLLGPESPFWDELAQEVYTERADPPRPNWRLHSAIVGGFLRDEQGNVIDTGDVHLTSEFGSVHSTKSDGNGFFAVFDLPSGTYDVQAPGASIDGERLDLLNGDVILINSAL